MILQFRGELLRIKRSDQAADFILPNQ